MLRLLSLFLVLMLCPRPALAIPYYGLVGYGQGGSPLKDSTGGQDYDVKAGTEFIFGGGFLLPVSATTPHQFEAQIGLCMLLSGSDSDNGVTWRRIPFEAMYFYRNTREKFRLGYGLTYHFDNKIDGHGNTASADTKVDNSTGWIFAAEILGVKSDEEPKVAFGLRYTSIKYHASSFNKDADGASLALIMTILGQ